MHSPSCPHGITLRVDVMKLLLNHCCLAKQLALLLANFVQPLKSCRTCAGPHSNLNDVLSYKHKIRRRTLTKQLGFDEFCERVNGIFFVVVFFFSPSKGKKRQSERPKWTQLEQSPVYD